MKTLPFLALAAILLGLPAVAAGFQPADARSDVQDIVFLADSRPVLIRLHLQLDGKPYLAAWNSFIDELFASLDANKDGVLDRDEAAKAPPPQAIFTSSGGGFFGSAAVGGTGVMDANGDGKVTRAELADYYRKNGGAPFQLVGGNNAGQMWANRVVLDTTGRIGGGSGSAEALNKALMALLDTNKDGKLSRKELAAAPALLLKKDANDDEMVTSGELLGEAPSGQQGYTVFFAGSMAAPVAADSPFVPITPGASTRALAKRLQAQYGRKGGKLDRKQLGLDEATFKLLDADEDGQLDIEELARFAQRPADVELTVSLGRGKGVSVTPVKGKRLPAGIKLTAGKGRQWEGRIDAGKPPVDTVALEVGNTHVDLRLEGGGNRDGIRFFPMTEQFYKMQFAAADQDNNGYLDRNEARRNGFFSSLFKQMDADGDGKLYLKEVLAYVKKQKALQEKASACCVSLSVSDQGRGLFDLLDKDGDGRLSVREMREAVKLIDRLDRNGDGLIESSEIPRRYQLGARRGASGGGNTRGAFAISTMEAPSGPPLRARNEGPLWFRKMDRNRDGDVSRREFIGSAELFKKIDTDGDGLISVEEAIKADALFRKQKK